MEPTPITRTLAAPGPFWTFNREERNAVAILFGLLTRPGNVEAFARLLDWQPADLAEVEICVEWTFLRDLWSHHSRTSSPDTLRSAILDALQPAARDALAVCSPLEFNTHFGAVPKPSSVYVQSPGNWSVARFDPTIADHEEFRRACAFKWAFNVKPDLVLQTPSGKVLCIEAKWDSGEGSYPSNEKEKAIFARRGIPYVSQTEVQRYLVNDLLGFDGEFAYLARRRFDTAAGRGLTWAEVLSVLDRSGSPAFIDQWCASVLDGGDAGPTKSRAALDRMVEIAEDAGLYESTASPADTR